MRKAKYIERGLQIDPDKLDRILLMHQNAQSITFFVQKYVLGKAIGAGVRKIVVRQHQMYRILSDLKQRNKTI